jgi:hypothetical protein
MTAKPPEPSPESRPGSAVASTPSPIPAQPAGAASSTPAETTGPTQTDASGPPHTDAAAPAPARSEPNRTAKSKAAPTKSAPTRPASTQPVPTKPASTKPPPARSARRRGSDGTGGAAILVAVCSLLLAVAASAIAVYALDVAREAKSQAAIAVSGAQVPSAAATAAGRPAASPSPSPTAPGRVFLAELSREELVIPPAQGCASVFVDVDIPRVGVDAGHEFYLSSCAGPLDFRIDRTAGATMAGPDMRPDQCVDQLVRAGPAQELVLPASNQLRLCLLTSKEDAQRQGFPQRVAFVEVRSIGTDRSVTVAVSTYRVPV